MEVIAQLIEVLLHVDQYLQAFLQDYGMWVYALLFVIIFAETGFVVTPFLPGDSLLFAAGALAAGSGLDVTTLCLLLITASFTGDNTNYWIGHHLGPKVFRSSEARYLNHAYLDRTHEFFEHHGGKTVFLARFLPILRTFSPFVAGVGRMSYLRFIGFSLSGSIAWVLLFVQAGFHFGSIPVVRQNIMLVMLGIIFVSILPALVVWIRTRLRRR